MLFLASALALGACVGGNAGQQPAWFAEEVAADERGYPSLREVPTTTIADTNQERWEEARRELMEAAQALRAHPRAQPAEGESPATFVEEARRELEETRQSHEPN
jgi:hypothetical protein